MFASCQQSIRGDDCQRPEPAQRCRCSDRNPSRQHRDLELGSEETESGPYLAVRNIKVSICFKAASVGFMTAHLDSHGFEGCEELAAEKHTDV